MAIGAVIFILLLTIAITGCEVDSGGRLLVLVKHATLAIAINVLCRWYAKGNTGLNLL